MNRRINIARAGLAGFVWGLLFGGPSLLSALINGASGDHYPDQSSLFTWALLPVLLLLFYFPLGFMLAIPYAALLGAWEQWTHPSKRRFLAGSLLLSMFCAAGPAAWYAQTIRAYLPESGFTGPQRLAVAGFVAALVAGYIVGRCLPQTGDNPARRAYRKYRVVLKIGVFLGLLVLTGLLSSVFFPTFATP